MITEAVHASKKALLLVFICSFILFILLRWDVDRWAEQQLVKVVQTQQLPLSWQNLHVSGLQLQLSNVRWHDPRLKEDIALDTVYVSPAWGALLSATPAVSLEADWQGNPIHANVMQQDGYTQLSDINVKLQLAGITAYLPVAAQLSGELLLQGEMSVEQNGLLHDGDISLQWEQVNISYMGVKLALGQSSLALQHQQHQQWNWQLDARGDVKAQGKGHMNIATPQPQQWVVDGQLSVSITPSTPMLLASMLRSSGADMMSWSIRGALQQPQLMPLPVK